MARVTVEDCVLKIPNRFELVLLAAQRADCVRQREEALAECATSVPDPVAQRRSADLQRTIEPTNVWSRFKSGKEGTVWFYRAVYERLKEVGFHAPIMAELERAVLALEAAARD